MSDKLEVDHDTRLLYLLLRCEDYLDQADFAALTRTSPGQVSLYERGLRTVPENVLDRAVEARRFPKVLVQPARRAIRSFRLAARGWYRMDKAITETFFADLLAWTGEALEVILRAGARVPDLRPTAALPVVDREKAVELWLRLEPWNPGQRLAIVEETAEFQLWALCELISAKSIVVAPSSPAQGLELAELALRIAELCAGDDWLCQRIQGYAWIHVANARRFTNDIPGSGVALETALKLWKAGASGDPGLFAEAIVLGLIATIRKAQGRLPEARRRIEEALAADHGSLRGKLLLTKAQILVALGDFEASTEALREAIPNIDEKREPRTALGVLCRFLGNLCLQDRAVEAAPHLREVEELAEQLGQEVDRVRVAVLGGLVAAGTGREEEAEKIFEQARRRFASFEPPLVLDYALVSLDLGLLLLEQGRTSEVRTLAEQMLAIFLRQRVPNETLAALQVFCEAANREAATVELARRVIRFLHRSEHHPSLKFEAEGIEVP